MTRPDPSDLFAADAFAMEAGSLCIRAVTAGQAGRFPEQRELVAKAAEHLAKALAKLNPVTVSLAERPTSFFPTALEVVCGEPRAAA